MVRKHFNNVHLGFSRPRPGAERSWRARAREARAGASPPPGRAFPGPQLRLSGPRAAQGGFCVACSKRFVRGSPEARERRETLQAQPPPLTPSLNRVPPRRAWPTVRPPLPNTHTKLIKPNSGGRDAPCSAKAEAPPCGAQGCSPIPGSLYPPPGASQGTPSQPGGNFGVRGSKPTGPAASWRPFAPIAQCGSRAREEQCGSPLHPGHS